MSIEEIRARWDLPEGTVANFEAFDRVKHHAPDDIAFLLAEVERLTEGAEEYDAILTRQADLLTRAANVLNGPPPELVWWSHHDIPELAAEMVERAETAEAALDIHVGLHEATRATLAHIADRVDDHVYTELAAHLDDGAIDRFGKTYRSRLAEVEAERDSLKAQVEHLVGIPGRWLLFGTWLVEEVGQCTCEATSQEPHGPECGVEPIVDLATLRGWEDLRKAAIAYRRPDGGGTKAEVWVVQHEEKGWTSLVLLAATREAAMFHLAIYCGVTVPSVQWEQRHSIFDPQEYWVAKVGEDEYHIQAMEIEA